jgi:ferredoxin
MEMTYLVRVDESACAAQGACVEAAPGVFELDDVARIVRTAPDAVLMAAAEACPSHAIIVLDSDTSEQLYP